MNPKKVLRTAFPINELTGYVTMSGHAPEEHVYSFSY